MFKYHWLEAAELKYLTGWDPRQMTGSYLADFNDFNPLPVLSTGFKRVRPFSLSAETVRHIWLPP